MRIPFSGLASLVVVVFSSGCGSSPLTVAPSLEPSVREARESPGLASEKPPACGTLETLAEAAAPMRRESSTVALRRQGAALFAYVADPDALTIDVIDVHARKVRSVTSTSGPVEQVMMLPSGHLAATIQDGSHVEVFAPGATGELRSVCSREVPPGAFGMAQSLDGSLMAVTSRTAGTVTLFATKDLAPQRVLGLPRAPAAALFTADAVYISHLVGAHVSVVTLESFDIATISTALTVAADETTPVRGAAGGASFSIRDFAFAPQSPSPSSSAAIAGGPKPPRTSSQAFSLVSVETTYAGEIGKRAGAPEGESKRGTFAGEPQSRADAPASPKQRIVVPMISVDPGGLSRPTSHYYGPPDEIGVPKQAQVGFLIDPNARAGLSRHLVADRPELAREPCYAPRGSAYDAATQSIFVACVGTDTLLELDARSADPMRAVRRSYRTPRGPTGVAIASEEGLAVVMASFEGRVSIIDLAKQTSEVVDMDVPLSASAEKHLVGRQLFYRANDRSLSFDGLACASCHVEGGEDGVSWMTPTGPRQTLMLAGRLAHSAPFGWDRNAEDLDAYVGGTVDRLGGEGLSDTQRKMLVEYISALPAPPVGVVDASKRIEGQVLFEANGCGDCHAGGESNGKPYDVGDAKLFDTPSLQRVSLSAPYYHDGRYATLSQLLRDKSNRMGRTAELDERSIWAIEHYLKSL